MVKKLIVIIAITTVVYLARDVYASEGITELRSTTGANYRCFATSLLMEDLDYTILVSCRDLIYPAGSDLFNYILWTIPTDSDKPTRLGTLDFGKKQFRTREAFSDLFITTEQDAGTRSPKGAVVMRGRVEPISFLQSPTSPTPTPEGQTSEKEELTVTKTEKLSTKDKLLLALRQAGIASVLAFAGILGLIFVITRSKG